MICKQNRFANNVIFTYVNLQHFYITFTTFLLILHHFYTHFIHVLDHRSRRWFQNTVPDDSFEEDGGLSTDEDDRNAPMYSNKQRRFNFIIRTFIRADTVFNNISKSQSNLYILMHALTIVNTMFETPQVAALKRKLFLNLGNKFLGIGHLQHVLHI